MRETILCKYIQIHASGTRLYESIYKLMVELHFIIQYNLCVKMIEMYL
jgi:hypothetical protein